MKWEQFKQMGPYTQEYTNKVLTDIECPKCGKHLFQRTDIILTSYPCQYQYECECGFIGYVFTQWNESGEVRMTGQQCYGCKYVVDTFGNYIECKKFAETGIHLFVDWYYWNNGSPEDCPLKTAGEDKKDRE